MGAFAQPGEEAGEVVEDYTIICSTEPWDPLGNLQVIVAAVVVVLAAKAVHTSWRTRNSARLPLSGRMLLASGGAAFLLGVLTGSVHGMEALSILEKIAAPSPSFCAAGIRYALRPVAVGAATALLAVVTYGLCLCMLDRRGPPPNSTGMADELH